ncbi:MAG: alpha/beta hydrolase, partial [Bacteroidota bacterium]
TARPNEGTNHPAILFVPGYNCFSMDNLPEGFVYQRIIQGYLDAGFVVHRIEKSGMGDNLNTPSCFETGFKLEMDVFRAGMESMGALEGVDSENLFIFGHSLGGCIAPILAEEFQPKGVIVYGTVHTAWYEYLLRMLSVQNPLFGLEYAEHSHDMRHYHELLYRHYVQKESIEALATENPDFLRILQRDFQYQGGEQLFARHTSFWQELNDEDLISAWKNTESYVLSIYGEADIEALDAWSHQEIANIVNQYHPGRAEFRLLENTTHGMVSVKSREHAVEVARDFQYNSQHFNPEFLEITIAWMQDKVSREAGTP